MSDQVLSGGQPPSNPAVHQQCVAYTRSSVQGRLDYFENQLNSNLKDSVAIFKL